MQYISLRDIFGVMHIITRNQLLDFAEKHPNTSIPLDAWYRIVKQSLILNFSELREIFPSADKVDNLTVFNIGGNKIRLLHTLQHPMLIYSLCTNT